MADPGLRLVEPTPTPRQRRRRPGRRDVPPAAWAMIATFVLALAAIAWLLSLAR